MKHVAIVVDSGFVADILRTQVTAPDTIVFYVGDMRSGWGADVILVLCDVSSTERKREWFEEFRCCLKPRGKIIHSAVAHETLGF